jgi:hypothetical protein
VLISSHGLPFAQDVWKNTTRSGNRGSGGLRAGDSSLNGQRMEGHSSKVGIIAAALLAAGIVWGWPRVFPTGHRVEVPRSPIIAFQNQMRRQMDQPDSYGAGDPVSAQQPLSVSGISHPWQAPRAVAIPSLQTSQAPPADDLPGSYVPPGIVTVIIVAEEPIETRQSLAAHAAYAEIRTRLFAVSP